MTLHVSCPHCGSTDIVSYDSIIATAGIQGWERGKDGELIPEYDGESDVDWNSQAPHYPQTPYECEGCGAFLSTPMLVVRDMTPEEEEAAS